MAERKWWENALYRAVPMANRNWGHYRDAQIFENMARTGEISAAEANRLKGANLYRHGLHPMVSLLGAYPYQMGQEVVRNLRGPISEGRSMSPLEALSRVGSGISEGYSAGTQNISGVLGSMVKPQLGLLDTAPVEKKKKKKVKNRKRK